MTVEHLLIEVVFLLTFYPIEVISNWAFHNLRKKMKKETKRSQSVKLVGDIEATLKRMLGNKKIKNKDIKKRIRSILAGIRRLKKTVEKSNCKCFEQPAAQTSNQA